MDWLLARHAQSHSDVASGAQTAPLFRGSRLIVARRAPAALVAAAAVLTSDFLAGARRATKDPPEPGGPPKTRRSPAGHQGPAGARRATKDPPEPGGPQRMRRLLTRRPLTDLTGSRIVLATATASQLGRRPSPCNGLSLDIWGRSLTDLPMIPNVTNTTRLRVVPTSANQRGDNVA
jgi:hypothetical protein